jgi:hypothetical protein
MKWETLTRELRGSGVYFVYDELDRSPDREKLCDLRKYPALVRLGLDQLTCPKGWQKLDPWSTNQFEFEGTEFIHMDDIKFPPTNDIAAITAQYYEDQHPQFSLSPIVDAYTRSSARLVLGSGTRNYQISGTVRPLREMDFLEADFEYQDIYDAFEDRCEQAGYRYPLNLCRNVFVQENALLFEEVTGERVQSIEGFFERLPDAPYLPIWRTLSDIFTAGVEQGTRLLDDDQRKGLGKWLRRRVELDYHQGREIAASLNALSRRRERLFDPHSRRELSEMGEARSYVESIKTDTELEARLEQWLLTALRGV